MTLFHNLYDIYLLLCAQYKTPDDGRRKCPKHVELYSKNKFEKLAHLVGFYFKNHTICGVSETCFLYRVIQKEISEI